MTTIEKTDDFTFMNTLAVCVFRGLRKKERDGEEKVTEGERQSKREREQSI